MIKPLRIIGISFGVLLLLLLTKCYYFFSELPDLCANTLIENVTSHDKKWKVVLFERDCGATTDFSSQISLLRVGETLQNEGGNVYIADGYSGNYEINWASSSVVKIRGNSRRIVKKLTQLNGVDFVYE